jgi:thiamine-phosphate pyrophosphorylase
MLRYAITSGSYNRGDAARWATDGIDFIQLREKVMNTAGLIDLARSILEEIASVPGSRTRLLINGRADVAVAAGADGVHLTSHPNELTPEEVRRIFAHSTLREPVISVSCHRFDEVKQAHDSGANLILFGPVFEKRIANQHITDGSGLKALEAACLAASTTPVLALGGINWRTPPPACPPEPQASQPSASSPDFLKAR